jgi:hypothetical protein
VYDFNIFNDAVLKTFVIWCRPIPVTARSKAWVCGPSLAGIAGSNPTGGMDVSLL